MEDYNLLNFGLEHATRWRPEKSAWKNDFTVNAAPAVTALRKLNISNNKAVRLVRAWQKRSQHNTPKHASIATVNRAFMMSSRTL